MGSESSKSESNSSKSDSDSSSNSGDNNTKLEEMICLKENENTNINRVWIVKKCISLSDGHVDLFRFNIAHGKLLRHDINKIKLDKPKKDVFKIKNESRYYFKHWAIIIELSNDSYVNVQFGKSGFSLIEFNKTNIEGESILNAIINTWGDDGMLFSFCYLGIANSNYNDLKIFLNKKKENEAKSFREEGKIFYHAIHNNCQHFSCDIEKFLFGSIKSWHSFDYYLDQFFDEFFSHINIDNLKEKYRNELNKKKRRIIQIKC